VLNAWKIAEDIPLYALAILYCLALLALAFYNVNFSSGDRRVAAPARQPGRARLDYVSRCHGSTAHLRCKCWTTLATDD